MEKSYKPYYEKITLDKFAGVEFKVFPFISNSLLKLTVVHEPKCDSYKVTQEISWSIMEKIPCLSFDEVHINTSDEANTADIYYSFANTCCLPEIVESLVKKILNKYCTHDNEILDINFSLTSSHPKGILKIKLDVGHDDTEDYPVYKHISFLKERLQDNLKFDIDIDMQ